MKRFYILLLFCIAITACETKKDDKGEVSFASNFNIINCPVIPSVYIDGAYVGDITKPSDSIYECGKVGNVTKELSVGEHSYTVKFKNESTGDNCIKDVTGKVIIKSNECNKVFIDVREP